MSYEENKTRILVVDDNPATCYATARVLRNAGFEVLQAETGAEALEQADKGVDAIVLDVNLPDMNGFEVCRQLRLKQGTVRVPVIHLSASFVKDIDKVIGLEAGADGYLTHPVEPPVLIATLNAFLRTRKAEEQLQKLLESERAARAEAERANRLKDEFLATLSHELRTPLNAIVGWSQLLSRGGLEADELAEGLEVIERNAKAQTQLISDLLDVSRITSGKLRLEINLVDLPTVINEAIESIKHACEAKQITLQRIIDTKAGPVSGDASRLQQVMWNLMTNAMKFTPRGGKITVMLARVNSHVEITVRDTGQGISAELLPHIFERFRQGDASTTREHGGLGLGLAIVRHLVEMHGGAVSVASEGAGKGSTFVVSLPAAPIAIEGKNSSADDADSDSNLREYKANLAGIRVLIVDDDADGRMLLRRFLNGCDAEVIEADSAAEALARLAEKKPDVLISDIGMPAEDGYMLIKEVRSRGFTFQDLPAIALTAFARTEDRRRALLAGYQIHMGKPVDPIELTAVVASLVGRTGE